MALAGHPRAMKSELFSPQGTPRPGATSGHEKGGSQRSRRGLFSGESLMALAGHPRAMKSELFSPQSRTLRFRVLDTTVYAGREVCAEQKRNSLRFLPR